MNNKATILIVDPDETSVLFLKEVLFMVSSKKDDYQIFSTPYGKKAIAFCHKQKPDLVFTEIRLKDMEGFRVIREIKELYPEIHVVTQTATVEEKMMQQVYEAGCDGCFTKPLNLSELESLIKSLFEISP